MELRELVSEFMPHCIGRIKQEGSECTVVFYSKMMLALPFLLSLVDSHEVIETEPDKGSV